ncbi:MAG: phenylacetate--CoA ligase family protein [Acidobacteria bacterium]|nr:phenylacetate--CoA ligase family protein [Acidobacteriota bacterium]
MAGFIDTVYLNSPIFIQQALVAAYGWQWYRRRFNPSFHQQVAEFTARDRWTAEQFRQYEDEKLTELLKVATRSSYYRTIFAEAGVTPDMPPREALAKLPFLSKNTLRTRSKELLTQDPLPKGVFIQRSSGSTGTPTEIYYTPDLHAYEVALPEARTMHWAGVNYQDRRVMFGARKVCHPDQALPPFWRFSPAEDLAYGSIYHLSRQNLPSYMAFLREFKPTVVMGYPNALNVLARYALRTGDMPAPAKVVVTTSETVTTQLRENIEAAWQCRLFDRYGAIEGCVFAFQCEHGRYHVASEAGIIEIVDPHGRPCAPGEVGELVCTGLRNQLQPLFRYRLGDAARWAVEQCCPCGREMAILEDIQGRIEDMCYTPDGRQVLRFDTVFKGVTNIREAQVIQEKPDLFIIKVVPAEGYNEHDSATLKHNMQLHVGHVRTEVELTDAIARRQSGKFQAVVCKLSPEEIEKLIKL